MGWTSWSPAGSTIFNLYVREHILKIFLFGDFSIIFFMNVMDLSSLCGKGKKIVTILILGVVGEMGGMLDSVLQISDSTSGRGNC